MNSRTLLNCCVNVNKALKAVVSIEPKYLNFESEPKTRNQELLNKAKIMLIMKQVEEVRKCESCQHIELDIWGKINERRKRNKSYEKM